jgi:uncharacterized protein YhfF
VDAIVRQLPATHEQGLPPIAFGAPGPVRDALNEAILSGSKTSSSNLLVAYRAGGEVIPVPGEARALLDSHGEPIALLRFGRISQRLLGDVDADLASLEGKSVEDWHRVHREFWSSIAPGIRAHLDDDDWEPSDSDVVVTTEFRVERAG